MYYKLRYNSTQFVIYYKLRNYYKLQRALDVTLFNKLKAEFAKLIANSNMHIKIEYN